VQPDGSDLRGPLAFLSGGGEMGARMRELDWAKTPLGVPEHWSRNLKTCVRIVLTSRQPMFVWWGESLVNLYNDAYKSIVGGKHPGALGMPAHLVWHEIWEQIAPRVATCMQLDEGTFDEALLLIMERNGYPEETYYTFSYSPVADDDGRPGGIICANSEDTRRIVGERQLAVLRDISARGVVADTLSRACREIESALAGRDVIFAAIYGMGMGTGTRVDDGGAERLISSGLHDVHAAFPERWSPDSASPWPIARVAGTRTAECVELDDELRATLPRGAWDRPPRHAMVLPIDIGGRPGAMLVGCNPYRLLDDDYRGFLGLVASQTAASLAAADARESESRRAQVLVELDRAKTMFFHNVSHEFRTPLTLMLGPLEDALTSGGLTGDDLVTTHGNAHRLLKLVNTLLDFSRLEAGRSDASFVEVDVAALTRDLAGAFSSTILRAELAFVVSCPQLSQTYWLDRDMWEKIVLNLLSNAFKFTFDGSIHVTLTEVAGALRLEVRDTGTGIPAHEIPHLFERFHRVQGARARTHEGSGIGLALVAELVKLHGGTIAVTSELDVGTTFTVTIPAGRDHLSAERVAAPRRSSSTSLSAVSYVREAERWLPEAEPAAPGPELADAHTVGRILVADDNADMRSYLARMLRERWQVEVVSDGALALASARRDPPALVVTDVMMPNLDGFGLLAALRDDLRTASVPVIMLSARAGEEARMSGLEAGADDYLPKPFSARELIAKVTTHLQMARLRAAAEAERSKLDAMFRQAPVPIAVLSGHELRFRVANAPMCEMTGRPTLVGMTTAAAFPELTDHPLIDLLRGVLDDGVATELVETGIPLMREGRPRDAYFKISATPMRDYDGRVDGVMVVAIEVTEQVAARQREEQLREAAERASRAKDEFLSTLSHELRTPLNAIVGWSQLLRAGTVPEAQRERALETVERNAQMQARLIEDMLDLSRIEQGKLVLSVGPVEMVRVVEAALDAVRPAAAAKGIRLQPVLDSHATIVGDGDRLQQIVWNLLSNAIKFTSKDGRIQIRLRRERSYVELVVADDGQGIAPEFLPHVFERFRQADGTFARRAGGLGLGLAIVRSLTELHGGVVSARSDGLGQGATFVVRLPTAPLRSSRESAPHPEPSAATAKTFECPPELGGRHILVVDDEPDTRELLRFVIEQCEATVTTCASGAEVIAALDSGSFDAIVSDIGMPGEDGHSLIRRIRARSPERGGRVPAVALTAYARGEDRVQALRAGFNMHLAKPIDASELLVVLATLIGGYGTHTID
jgi:signal transduction histidine kinase